MNVDSDDLIAPKLNDLMEPVAVVAVKPKTKIQLQFPDCSKKAEGFNTDHNVGDLRAVRANNVGQPVKVKDGFPTPDLVDDTLTLEAARLEGVEPGRYCREVEARAALSLSPRCAPGPWKHVYVFPSEL